MKYARRLEDKKKELIAEIGKCEKCGHTKRLTIDHIIPLAILKMMGFSQEETFDVENFAVICGICNALKSDRLDFSNPKTKPLLIKYLDIL